QVDGYFARHNVKPGITGWAQINGYRGETDTLEEMSNRVRYDLEYIDRGALLFDLKILFLTAFRVWLQEAAYGDGAAASAGKFRNGGECHLKRSSADVE